jgi:2-methylcitrate dehydratase PrpD
MALAPLIYTMPNAPLEGKFSLHYCLAAALQDGRVNLATFTAERIGDARLRDLIPRITMEVDERFRDDSEFPTAVEVETEAGARHEKTVLLAPGKPERWFTEAQMLAKFTDCATRALPDDAVATAYAGLRALDRAEPVAALLAALRATGPAPAAALLH